MTNNFSKIKFSLVVGVLTISMLVVPALSAQDSTNDADSDQTEASTSETLRERIEKIVEKQKDNVENALGELVNRRRGFVGQVVRVSQETLTINSRGATRVVSLSEAKLMKTNAEIEPDEVAVDDWVMVLGLTTEDSFTPKKVTLLAKSPRPDPHVTYLGALKEINKSSLEFQVRGQEEIISVDLDSNTKYQDDAGEETELVNFVEDDQVLLVGYTDQEDTIVTVIRALAPFTRE